MKCLQKDPKRRSFGWKPQGRPVTWLLSKSQQEVNYPCTVKVKFRHTINISNNRGSSSNSSNIIIAQAIVIHCMVGLKQQEEQSRCTISLITLKKDLLQLSCHFLLVAPRLTGRYPALCRQWNSIPVLARKSWALLPQILDLDYPLTAPQQRLCSYQNAEERSALLNCASSRLIYSRHDTTLHG